VLAQIGLRGVDLREDFSVTFFSPWHSVLMIFTRMGVDMSRKISAARWNTASVG